MMFKRLKLILGCLLVLLPLNRGVAADIEDRFIYSDFSKRISMDFKDASLNDVLKIFSQQSGMNFISAQDVSTKKVTLFLDNIPVEEALEKILDANDLTYVMAPNSDVFVVKPKPKGQLITKVFFLKYATVASSKIHSASSEDTKDKGDSGGDSAGAGSKEGSKDEGSTEGNLSTALKAVLTKNGKLEEDPRTNSFVITDEPDQFPLIEETISKLDVPVLQILIQVEMIDVSKGTSDLIGVSYQDPSKPILSFKGAQRDVVYPFDQYKLLGKGYIFEDPEYRVGTVDASGMRAALDFYKSQSDSRTLARPRILTLNNQTAKIEISTNEAIGLNLTSSGSTSATATSVAQAERTKTGVLLEVTPQANAETGDILMAVNPKVIVAHDGTIINPSNNKVFKDPEQRSAKSLLKVHNGETIIIGGLLRKEDSNTVTKLPVLGDIPLVGALFRHKDVTSAERELIIFITPNILDDRVKQKIDTEVATHLMREMHAPEKVSAINQELDYSEIGQ